MLYKDENQWVMPRYGFTNDLWGQSILREIVSGKIDNNVKVGVIHNMEQYIKVKIGDLKPGDHFTYGCSYESIEYRIVDPKDYEKVFGKPYKYSNVIIVLRINTNTFSHFNDTKTVVKIKQRPIPLFNLSIGCDFELDNIKYVLVNKGLCYNDFCHCIALADNFKNSRNFHISGAKEALPI